MKNNHNILFKTSTIREKKIRHHKLRQKEGPGQSGERNGNEIKKEKKKIFILKLENEIFKKIVFFFVVVGGRLI